MTETDDPNDHGAIAAAHVGRKLDREAEEARAATAQAYIDSLEREVDSEPTHGLCACSFPYVMHRLADDSPFCMGCFGTVAPGDRRIFPAF